MERVLRPYQFASYTPSVRGNEPQNPNRHRGPYHSVDDERPPLPATPPDPWDEVDDDNPHPVPAPKKRRRVSFDQAVAAHGGVPPVGCHRRRPAKPGKAEKALKAAEKAKKQRAAAHSRRKDQRARQLGANGHVPSPATVAAYVQPAIPLTTDLDSTGLPTTLGAYSAKVVSKTERRGSKVQRSLADLIALGFRRIKWDGATPCPLLDKHGRIIAVLAGRLNRDAYLVSATTAFHAIRSAGLGAQFPAALRQQRRGLFAAINAGLFYGKGQAAPCWLNNKEYTPLVDGLLANGDVRRLEAFALWAPRLYKYYREHDATLLFNRPHLRRPFVLGRFDATKGGHLVLWDLELVVEFPHGALILLPSATIAHSNVPVGPGEERASFTQFTSGGIFRYVDNGCCTVNELAEEDPEEYERLMALKEGWWEAGLNLLSTLDELLPDN
ncbi:hypothetical protein B0H13DRAFT_2388016 [Mycena leptocephala]|nr:hypothetical protein B0H13DRAFT_2388016 [Mycena leptocephala]